MNALRNIEAEPLGEQRWAKIERSLLARAERELRDTAEIREPRVRRWAPAMVVGATLASAFGATLFVTREQPQPTAVEAPSRIATGPSASRLALPGVALDVGPHSAVVVGGETSQGLLIVLDQGSIVCEVAPRATDKPLIVQAGGTRVRVLGTRFSVTRLGETARVSVEHGVVEVLSAGGKWRVAGGEEWPPSVPSGTPLVGTAPPPSSGPSGEASPLSSTSRAPESRHERVASRARTAPLPSASARPAPVEAVAKAEPSRQDVFEQATALERGDPARAAQLYGTLESGGDSWAQNALYARGRLAAARGNSAAARRLLTEYLQRFPKGSNAEDARAVLQRLR